MTIRLWLFWLCAGLKEGWSPVKLNAPGPQGAVPAGIERSSAVLNRISDSGKARGDTSSTTLRSRKFYILVENKKLLVFVKDSYKDGQM